MTAGQRLGVAEDASEAAIRAAYLAKVKEFPPDRFPDEFEKVRDAYEQLSNPRSRAKAMLFTKDYAEPFSAIAEGLQPQRMFAGPKAWLAVLKDKR